jgi:hypothetical protein
MKKLVLIMLAASLLPYSHSIAQPSSAFQRLFETQFYAQNSNQFITTGIIGLAGWIMLPYASFSFAYKSTENGKRTADVNVSFDGNKAQQSTKYIILPLALASISAGLFGILNK